MTQGSVRDTTGYVNYVYNISARGTTQVASQLMGLSGITSNILGQLAFQTSSYLSSTESALMSMGVVASAGFAKAVQKASEFDQALATIGAISGKTTGEVSGLGNEAIAMSNKFGMAVGEMTHGLEALARAGVSTGNMNAILEQAMGLSKLEGLSLETAINDLISTTNLLDIEGLDLESPEYAEAIKRQNQRITATSEAAPINAQDIIHTLEHVGGYASSTNLDQEDLFAVIAQLGSKGTKSEMAGTSLRAFLAAGQKDTAQRALKRIGLSVKDLWKNDETIMSITDMKDVLDEAMEAKGYTKQEKLEFYSDFAGYKQANQIMKIDTNSAREFKEKISNSWDMSKKIEQVIGTAETNIQGLIQAGTNLLIKVGEPMLPIISMVAGTTKTIIELVNRIPGANIVIAGGLLLASVKAISVIFNKIAPQLAAAKGNIGGVGAIFKSIREDLSESYTYIKNINNTEFMKQKARENEASHITDQDKINFWRDTQNRHIKSLSDVWQLEYKYGFGDDLTPYIKWKQEQAKKPIVRKKIKRETKAKQRNARHEQQVVPESPQYERGKKPNVRHQLMALSQAVDNIAYATTTILSDITSKLDDVVSSVQLLSSSLNTLQQALEGTNINVTTNVTPDTSKITNEIKIDDNIFNKIKSHVFKVQVIDVPRIVPVHEVGEKRWGEQKQADREVDTFVQRGFVEVHDGLTWRGMKVKGIGNYTQKSVRLDKKHANTSTKDHELGHALFATASNASHRKMGDIKLTQEDDDFFKSTGVNMSTRAYSNLGKLMNEYEADMYAIKLAQKRGEEISRKRVKRAMVAKKIIDKYNAASDIRFDYIDDMVNATVVQNSAVQKKFVNPERPKKQREFNDDIVEDLEIDDFFYNLDTQINQEPPRKKKKPKKKKPKTDDTKRKENLSRRLTQLTDKGQVFTSFSPDYNPPSRDFLGAAYSNSALVQQNTPENVIRYRNNSMSDMYGLSNFLPSELIPYEAFAAKFLSRNPTKTHKDAKRALNEYEQLLFVVKLFKTLERTIPNETLVNDRLEHLKNMSNEISYFTTEKGKQGHYVREKLNNEDAIRYDYVDDAVQIAAANITKIDQLLKNAKPVSRMKDFKPTTETGSSLIKLDKKTQQTGEVFGYTLTNIEPGSNTDIGYTGDLLGNIKAYTEMAQEPGFTNWRKLLNIYDYYKDDPKTLQKIMRGPKSGKDLKLLIGAVGEEAVSKAAEQYRMFRKEDALSVPKEQFLGLKYDDIESASLQDLNKWEEQMLYEYQEWLNLSGYATDYSGSKEEKILQIKKLFRDIAEIKERNSIALQYTNPEEVMDYHKVSYGDPLKFYGVLTRGVMSTLNYEDSLGIDVTKDVKDLKPLFLDMYSSDTKKSQALQFIDSVKESSLYKTFDQLRVDLGMDTTQFTKELRNQMNKTDKNITFNGLITSTNRYGIPKITSKNNTLFAYVYALLDSYNEYDEDATKEFVNGFINNMIEAHDAKQEAAKATIANTQKLMIVESEDSVNEVPAYFDNEYFINNPQKYDMGGEEGYYDDFLREHSPIPFEDTSQYNEMARDPLTGRKLLGTELTDEQLSFYDPKKYQNMTDQEIIESKKKNFIVFDQSLHDESPIVKESELKPHHLHNPSARIKHGYQVNWEYNSEENKATYQYHLTKAKNEIRTKLFNIARLRQELQDVTEFEVARDTGFITRQSPDEINSVFKQAGLKGAAQYNNRFLQGKNIHTSGDITPYGTMRFGWLTVGSTAFPNRRNGYIRGSSDVFTGNPYEEDYMRTDPAGIWRKSLGLEFKGGIPRKRGRLAAITPARETNVPYIFTRAKVSSGIFTDEKDKQDMSTALVLRDEKGQYSFVDSYEQREKRKKGADMGNIVEAQAMLATHDPYYDFSKRYPQKMKPPGENEHFILTSDNIKNIALNKLTPLMKNVVGNMYNAQRFTNLEDLEKELGPYYKKVVNDVQTRWDEFGVEGTNAINQFKTWVYEDELKELEDLKLVTEDTFVRDEDGYKVHKYDTRNYEVHPSTDGSMVSGTAPQQKRYLIYDWKTMSKTPDDVAEQFTTQMIARSMMAYQRMTELELRSPSSFYHTQKSLHTLASDIQKDPTSILKIKDSDAINLAATNDLIFFDIIQALKSLESLDPKEIERYISDLSLDDLDETKINALSELGYHFEYDESNQPIGFYNNADELVPTYEALYSTLDNIVQQATLIKQMTEIYDVRDSNGNFIISEQVIKDTIRKVATENVEQIYYNVSGGDIHHTQRTYDPSRQALADQLGLTDLETGERLIVDPWVNKFDKMVNDEIISLISNLKKNEDVIIETRAISIEDSPNLFGTATIGDFLDEQTKKEINDVMNEQINQGKSKFVQSYDFLRPVTAHSRDQLPRAWLNFKNPIVSSNIISTNKEKDTINMGNVISGQDEKERRRVADNVKPYKYQPKNLFDSLQSEVGYEDAIAIVDIMNRSNIAADMAYPIHNVGEWDMVKDGITVPLKPGGAGGFASHKGKVFPKSLYEPNFNNGANKTMSHLFDENDDLDLEIDDDLETESENYNYNLNINDFYARGILAKTINKNEREKQEEYQNFINYNNVERNERKSKYQPKNIIPSNQPIFTLGQSDALGFDIRQHGYDSIKAYDTHYKLTNKWDSFKNSMSNFVSPYINSAYDKYGVQDVDEHGKTVNNRVSEQVEKFGKNIDYTTETLKGFSGFLQEASDIFPPLITAVIALDGVIGAMTSAQKVAGGIDRFLNIGELLEKEGQIEIFNRTISQTSNVGKMITTLSSTLGVAIETLEGVFFTLLKPIALIVAAFMAIKGALDWSYKSHEKYLKQLQDEEKTNKSKSKSLQTINEQNKKALLHNKNEKQEGVLARKYQLSNQKLQNANLIRTSGALKLTGAENDTLWGKYGIASALDKMQGKYESTAADYDGTSGQIRRIKEHTTGGQSFLRGMPGYYSEAEEMVAAYYDANKLAIGVMDEYKDELGELYDAETNSMRKHPDENPRETKEFQQALDKFVEATGITREHAQQYLDYMQTEHNVDNASQAMQAQADMISSRTEMQIQAIAFGGNPSDVLGLNGIEAQQNAMVQAQADMIQLELSSQLWWKAVWSTITSPIRAIISPIFAIAHVLSAIWAFVTGNWDSAGMHMQQAGASLNVLGETGTYWGAWATAESTDFNAIGQSAIDENDRANYGNAVASSRGGGPRVPIPEDNSFFGIFPVGWPDSKQSSGAHGRKEHKETVAQNAQQSFLGQLISPIVGILSSILLAISGGFLISGLSRIITNTEGLSNIGEKVSTFFSDKNILGNLKDKISSFKEEGIGGGLKNLFNVAGIKEEAEWYRHGGLDNASVPAKIYGKYLNYREEHPPSATLQNWQSYPGEKFNQFKDMAFKSLLNIDTPTEAFKQHVISKIPGNLDTDEISDEQIDALAEKYNIDTSSVSTSLGKRTLVGGELRKTGKWNEAMGEIYDKNIGTNKTMMGENYVDFAMEDAKEKGLISTAKTVIGKNYADPWKEYMGKKGKDLQSSFWAMQEKAEWYRNGIDLDEDQGGASPFVKAYATGLDYKEKIFGKAENTNFEELLTDPKKFLSDPRKIEGMGKDIYSNYKQRYQNAKNDPGAQEEYDWYREGGNLRFADLSRENKIRAVGDKLGDIKHNVFGMEQGESVQEMLKNPERTMEVLRTGLGNIRENGFIESLGLDEDFGITDAVKDKVSGFFDKIKEGAEEGIDEDSENDSLFGKMKKKLAGFFGLNKEVSEEKTSEPTTADKDPNSLKNIVKDSLENPVKDPKKYAKYRELDRIDHDVGAPLLGNEEHYKNLGNIGKPNEFANMSYKEKVQHMKDKAEVAKQRLGTQKEFIQEETPGAVEESPSILDLADNPTVSDIREQFRINRKGDIGDVINKVNGSKGGKLSGLTKKIGGSGKLGGLTKKIGGVGKLAKGGIGKIGSKIGTKVMSKVGTKVGAQVASKVLAGGLAATGIGAPLAAIMASPIGGFLMEGAMNLGGKALGAVGGAIKGIGGFLGFGRRPIGGGRGGGGLLKGLAMASPLGMLAGAAGGLLGGVFGGKGPGNMGKMGGNILQKMAMPLGGMMGILGKMFSNDKQTKSLNEKIEAHTGKTLDAVKEQNAKSTPSANNSGGNITIQNININTADDPEAIKAMFLELIVELQEQVNPRLVSRTAGKAPESSTTSTSPTEESEESSENVQQGASDAANALNNNNSQQTNN